MRLKISLGRPQHCQVTSRIFFFLKQHRNSEFNHLFVIKSLSICSSIGPNKGHRNIFRRRKILIAYNQAHISLSFAGLIFGPCLPQFLQTKTIQYFLVFMVPQPHLKHLTLINRSGESYMQAFFAPSLSGQMKHSNK